MVMLRTLFISLIFITGLLKTDATPDLKLTKITTSIESVRDQRVKGRGLDKIVDGDSKSYYWTGGQMQVGQVVTFQFSQAIPIGKTVKIYTGLGIENREDDDSFRDAVLESSKDDAKTWQQVATFHCGNAEVKAEARAIKNAWKFLTSSWRDFLRSLTEDQVATLRNRTDKPPARPRAPHGKTPTVNLDALAAQAVSVSKSQGWTSADNFGTFLQKSHPHIFNEYHKVKDKVQSLLAPEEPAIAFDESSVFG